MPPRVQKITSVSVPLVADIASCCSGIFFAFATCFDARDDLRMIAAAVRDRRAVADLHVAVLRLADRRIIRRVRHIHDQRDVRLERIGDLPRAEQADFLLHVRDGANFGVQLCLCDSFNNRNASATAKVPMRLSNARATARSLRNNSNSSLERDRIADAHQFLRVLAAAHADVDEQIVNLRQLAARSSSLASDAARHCRRRL